MINNGQNPTTNLRVLLSGPAADLVAGTLEQAPSIAVIRAESSNGTSPVSADVALHVLESSSASGVAEAAAQLRDLAGAPLILASYGEPNGIVETGLAVGAADVLVLPQPAETLIFAIRKAAKTASGSEFGKVLTVFSPKGGSGKTVLATNLAAAAARRGVKTLLIDLDLQFGDSALSLAVTPRATISDLARSHGLVDVDKLKAFVSSDERTGLDLLAGPRRPEEADVVGQNELAAALEVARTAYGAVVIDTGPLFDGAMLAALDHTDELLLICNPEVTSLKNVRIGLETIDRLGFARDQVSLVVNRLGAKGGVDRGDIEQALDTKIAYALPDDPAVPASVNRALPIVVADESSSFASAVIELAGAVLPRSRALLQETPQAQRRFLLRGRR
jgi:MinD-like ATPase involved in chromosome partitioning or flagellar assembly